MIIHSASFIKSSASLKQCPPPVKPEFGFIGRSNVGKSSLINMLTGNSHLAKTSRNPGKTKTINHFLINESCFLVDLPGYGYARVPESIRQKWQNTSTSFILNRETLLYMFVLLDSRLDPQKSDLAFMEFLGNNQVPFARVFTKSDKVSSDSLKRAINKYDLEMSQTWEELPITFITSSVNKSGREEILNFIEETFNKFWKSV
jgi:GTP-binding protein